MESLSLDLADASGPRPQADHVRNRDAYHETSAAAHSRGQARLRPRLGNRRLSKSPVRVKHTFARASCIYVMPHARPSRGKPRARRPASGPAPPGSVWLHGWRSLLGLFGSLNVVRAAAQVHTQVHIDELCGECMKPWSKKVRARVRQPLKVLTHRAPLCAYLESLQRAPFFTSRLGRTGRRDRTRRTDIGAALKRSPHRNRRRTSASSAPPAPRLVFPGAPSAGKREGGAPVRPIRAWGIPGARPGQVPDAQEAPPR